MILQERLGEGLTSEVYKAIRKHRSLKIEQTVAVKILRSQKAVQALKNEIHILSGLESLHCVRLLGWSDLPRGPAILLEYLDGVSLAELCLYENLTDDLIYEVVAQLQQGLRDLHQHSILHGDLSAKNIFVTRRGIVKILDFGFSALQPDRLHYGTPQFLSLEGWRGGGLEATSDYFSLGLLLHDLLRGELLQNKTREFWRERAELLCDSHVLLRSNPADRRFLPLTSEADHRHSLAALVERAQAKKKSSGVTTHVLGLSSARRGSSIWWRRVSASFVFAVVLLAGCRVSPPSEAQARLNKTARIHALDVRSHGWARIHLYKRSEAGVLKIHDGIFTPHRFSQLPEGIYELHWMSGGRSGKISVQLNQTRRILIR